MIEIAGISKRYGERLVLDNISLQVKAGEIVALVGPNGAGKSTTLRILAGLSHPNGGTVAIGGHDTVKDGTASRRALGYLPQELGVPPRTIIWDLMVLTAGMRGVPIEAARTAMANVGLAHRQDAALEKLSGGERQRVMLALATLGNIRALVLDEPSISLDSGGAEVVRDLIRQASADGAAVLFASHHLTDVAVLADRIVVMVAGNVIAEGTLADLARQAGIAWSDRMPLESSPLDRIYRELVQKGRAACHLAVHPKGDSRATQPHRRGAA
jgi:ABC-type multidrug transport system ATPase subunit